MVFCTNSNTQQIMETNNKSQNDQNVLVEKLTYMQIDHEPEVFTSYVDLEKRYEEKENTKLIQHHGPDVYDYSKEMEEKLKIPNNFLSKHKIDPNIRTKMVDWMIEVLVVYHSDEPTLFLAVHIMDQYFAKSKAALSNNDVHLIGITCLFIASKMEDIIPLRMSHVRSKIGHNKFSEAEIKKKEKQILEAIGYDLITSSTAEFIKTFIFDFLHNNKEHILKLDMADNIVQFDNICIFLAKMMLHSEEFSSINYSLKAIACIIAAFDILRSNSHSLTKDSENFIRQWILFIINESNYGSDSINSAYTRIVDFYAKYETINYINFNLNKTHPMEF